MKLKMSTILWHDPKLMSPAKDGKYLVCWIGETTIMGFTTECGWNTTRDLDGEVDPSTEIEPEMLDLWAALPTITERSLDDSVE